MYHLIINNYNWMTYNILLALIPVFLGWLIYYIKSKLIKTILFIAWLLFVPNTIYVFTDIIHLFKDIKHVSITGGIIVAIQYLLLLTVGFLTFIFSLYPIERVLRKENKNKNKKKKRRNVYNFLIGINFLIGFGIVLGRVYRLNSWDIFGETERLIYATAEVLSTPSMLMLVILFGLFANLVYFLFKTRIRKLFLKKI